MTVKAERDALKAATDAARDVGRTARPDKLDPAGLAGARESWKHCAGLLRMDHDEALAYAIAAYFNMAAPDAAPTAMSLEPPQKLTLQDALRDAHADRPLRLFRTPHVEIERTLTAPDAAPAKEGMVTKAEALLADLSDEAANGRDTPLHRRCAAVLCDLVAALPSAPTPGGIDDALLEQQAVLVELLDRYRHGGLTSIPWPWSDKAMELIRALTGDGARRASPAEKSET